MIDDIVVFAVSLGRHIVAKGKVVYRTFTQGFPLGGGGERSDLGHLVALDRDVRTDGTGIKDILQFFIVEVQAGTGRNLTDRKRHIDRTRAVRIPLEMVDHVAGGIIVGIAVGFVGTATEILHIENARFIEGKLTGKVIRRTVEGDIGRTLGDVLKSELDRTGGRLEHVGIIILSLVTSQREVHQRIVTIHRVVLLIVTINIGETREIQVDIAVIFATKGHITVLGRVEGIPIEAVSVLHLSGENGFGTVGFGGEFLEAEIAVSLGISHHKDNVTGLPGEGLVVLVGGTGAGSDGGLDGDRVLSGGDRSNGGFLLLVAGDCEQADQGRCEKEKFLHGHLLFKEWDIMTRGHSRSDRQGPHRKLRRWRGPK